MRLDEMMTQCGHWSIGGGVPESSVIGANIFAADKTYYDRGLTPEDAMIAVLNDFAECKRNNYPWIIRIIAYEQSMNEWGWLAVRIEDDKEIGAFGDTIVEACEKLKPKPKPVTLHDICSTHFVEKSHILLVDGKPVIGCNVKDDYIELKTES